MKINTRYIISISDYEENIIKDERNEHWLKIYVIISTIKKDFKVEISRPIDSDKPTHEEKRLASNDMYTKLRTIIRNERDL